MADIILTEQHRERLRVAREIQKTSRKQAREAMIADRRSDFSNVINRLEESIKKALPEDTKMKIYLNQSQLNVDFTDADKAYMTCSRTHKRVRVQMRLRTIEKSHGQEVCDFLKKTTHGRYKFTVEDLKAENALQVGTMVPEEEIPFFFSRVDKFFVPLFCH